MAAARSVAGAPGPAAPRGPLGTGSAAPRAVRSPPPRRRRADRATEATEATAGWRDILAARLAGLASREGEVQLDRVCRDDASATGRR